jgi:hypothetical protein
MRGLEPGILATYTDSSCLALAVLDLDAVKVASLAEQVVTEASELFTTGILGLLQQFSYCQAVDQTSRFSTWWPRFNMVASIIESLHRLELRTTWMYRPLLTQCQDGQVSPRTVTQFGMLFSMMVR